MSASAPISLQSPCVRYRPYGLRSHSASVSQASAIRPQSSGRNAVRPALRCRAISPPASPAIASALEHEGALQGVVAADVEVDPELGVLRAVARRLADEDRRARNGGEDGVGQRRVGAGRALEGLELRIGVVADLDGALAALDVERD